MVTVKGLKKYFTSYIKKDPRKKEIKISDLCKEHKFTNIEITSHFKGNMYFQRSNCSICGKIKKEIVTK